MKTHTVKPGETIEQIAIAYLYNPQKSNEILRINNVSDIYAGQILKIPDLFGETEKLQTFEGAALIINGEELKATPAITIKKTYDNLASTFGFSLPTEEIYRIKPFMYDEVSVYFQGNLIVKGNVYGIEKDLSTGARTSYSCMQQTAVLAHCNLPKSLYPRTQYKVSLKTVAERICDVFGIDVEVDAGATEAANKKFAETAIKPNETLAEYLSNLAKQRGLIITSTPEGNLRIAVDTLNKVTPILELKNPTGKITFSGDKVFSDIMAVRPATGAAQKPDIAKIVLNAMREKAAKAKKEGWQSVFSSEEESKSFNERLKAAEKAQASTPNVGNPGGGARTTTSVALPVFRPKTIMQSTAFPQPIKDFAEAEKRRMLVSACSLQVSLSYVYTTEGDLIDVNQIVTVNAPALGIDEDTDFIIREVTIKLDTGGNSCNLTMIPADWYQGNMVQFWS